MNKKYKKAFEHLLIDTVNRDLGFDYMSGLLISLIHNYNIVINVDVLRGSFINDNDVKNYSSFEQFKTKYKEIVNNHFKGGKLMKVQNMTSNNGNKIANQFIIYDNDKTYFQSYNSIIVKKDTLNNKIYLDSYFWDYSTTTSKYRNIFLGEKKKDTQKKIKEGIYILTNLNKGE